MTFKRIKNKVKKTKRFVSKPLNKEQFETVFHGMNVCSDTSHELYVLFYGLKQLKIPVNQTDFENAAKFLDGIYASLSPLLVDGLPQLISSAAVRKK